MVGAARDDAAAAVCRVEPAAGGGRPAPALSRRGGRDGSAQLARPPRPHPQQAQGRGWLSLPSLLITRVLRIGLILCAKHRIL